MKLIDVICRRAIPEPWQEGEKILWSDPAFSKRMLLEHLSQKHDAASRRFAIIEKQVAWIHHELLLGKPAKILDLGCSPGLYASRLAKFGHECVGIDFSPASIAYAVEQARAATLPCSYCQEDMRLADFGTGYGLVMLIFGEFNVFSPSNARTILLKAHRALDDNGLFLLEPHTFEAVREMGYHPKTWYSADNGLFSDRPHICLSESFWDAERHVATERYFIIDALTGQVTQHTASTQAYTQEEYSFLLHECGFGEIIFYPSLMGVTDEPQRDLIAIVARKVK